jgi:hypothetical protein
MEWEKERNGVREGKRGGGEDISQAKREKRIRIMR